MRKETNTALILISQELNKVQMEKIKNKERK